MFNTAEKLVRYTDAPYMAIGVFHGTVFEKMASMLARQTLEQGEALACYHAWKEGILHPSSLA